MRAAERLHGKHAVADEQFGQCRGRAPHPLSVEGSQRRERLAYGPIVASAWTLVVEPTASIDPLEKVDVRARVRWGAKGGNEGHLVRRVVDRAQTGQQVAHLL